MIAISAKRITALREPDLESLPREVAQQWLDYKHNWTLEEYFAFDEQRHLEYANGLIEVLPVPTEYHQDLIDFILEHLKPFIKKHAPGKVSFSGLRVRLWGERFCEPDIVYMKKENAHRRLANFWDGADLAMEVVSTDSKDRRRDLLTKRRDYAKGGIPEYWIIDPKKGSITVLVLKGKRYQVHGHFKAGTVATSVLLKGFTVSVSDLFAQETMD